MTRPNPDFNSLSVPDSSQRKIPADVRAVFFDIDDTFFSHRLGRIPEGYLKMVQKLRKQGVFCALCTARSLELSEILLGPQNGLWDGVVAGNGACVYDENQNVLFCKTLDPHTIEALIETGRKHDAGFFVSGSQAFVFDNAKYYQPKLDSIHTPVLPRHAWTPEQSLSVISMCVPDPLALRKELDALDGLFVHYTKYSADISRDDLSKFEGISRLMKHWNLPEHAYAAFGDSFNDLDMLDNAACPVAMAEGEQTALDRYPAHTPPVEEGGIAAWMKAQGWIE